MLQSWNGKYHQRYTPPFAQVSRSCFQISESGNRTARRFRSRFCFFRGRRQASQAARAAAASPDRKISIADPFFYGKARTPALSSGDSAGICLKNITGS